MNSYFIFGVDAGIIFLLCTTLPVLLFNSQIAFGNYGSKTQEIVIDAPIQLSVVQLVINGLNYWQAGGIFAALMLKGSVPVCVCGPIQHCPVSL